MRRQHLLALPCTLALACQEDAAGPIDADDVMYVAVEGDGAIAAIDAATGEVLLTTPVGEAPNGITCVHAGEAMP